MCGKIGFLLDIPPVLASNSCYGAGCLRDVALAQIVAMENPDVAGRHCFCNEAVHLSTVLQVIHEAFHDMELPTRKVRMCGGLL
jgi:hypothetical protein